MEIKVRVFYGLDLFLLSELCDRSESPLYFKLELLPRFLEVRSTDRTHFERIECVPFRTADAPVLCRGLLNDEFGEITKPVGPVLFLTGLPALNVLVPLWRSAVRSVRRARPDLDLSQVTPFNNILSGYKFPKINEFGLLNWGSLHLLVFLQKFWTFKFLNQLSKGCFFCFALSVSILPFVFPSVFFIKTC